MPRRLTSALFACLCLALLVEKQAQAETVLAAASASADPAQNVESLRQQVADRPDDADLWRRLAAAEAAAGDLDKAYAAITCAIALAPEDRDIQLARANILLWQDRLPLARDQAETVRAVDPDYPGLAQFDRAFARRHLEVSGFEPLSISAVLGTSDIVFDSGLRQKWQNAVVAIAFGNVQRTVFSLDADAERRTVTDVRLSARASTRIRNGSYYFGAGITPNADFRDQWRLVAGGQILVAPGLRGTADLRLAKYRSGISASIEPGIALSAGRGVTLSARMINLLDGDGDYRIGGSVRADYEMADGHILFASAARYPDREADITRQLRSFALGATLNIAPKWRLRLAAADEKREDSYHRQALNIGLTYQFFQP
ncbi:YaiO family outer membrane beta-barrel protein [Parasphingorhabdus sp.]|uniref:YaiO family outer membrane beta-barrel protein n=1 Tax=Parasphingorhabdus sp. TaxID=2709688 RepID=UPI003A8F5461